MSCHPPTPSWRHPLFGADPWTLAGALTCSGALPARVWPLAGALMGVSLARAPFSLGERALAAVRMQRAPAPRAPVFILGHWRSGTTHLFNLLSRDPRFAWADPYAAGMPWDFMVLGRWLRPLLARALPASRFVDNVAVGPDAPQEDEIALASMQSLSYYHGIFFPRRFRRRYRQGVFAEQLARRALQRRQRRFQYFHRKCLVGRPGATLLVKNPVYTGRVAEVLQAFPDARFIHIHRNPYLVFESTRRFYRALLPRFALQPFPDGLADELVLWGYPRMIEALYRDVEALAPGRFVELGFEDLEREPVEQLERIYRALDMPGFGDLRGVFRRYLAGVAQYRKNDHVIGDDIAALVDRHWGDLVRRWGYEPPATGMER